MNNYLAQIKKLIEDASLSSDALPALLKALADADKQWAITDFKLDRTEKVKRTTAILLEETIEELEQKRKAVEGQNRELEIETALERVRSIAMSMNKADDMLEVCKTVSQQLELLNVKEVRNVQTAIFYKEKSTYMNYEYYAKHDRTFITETTYSNNKKHAEFAENMQKGGGESFELAVTDNELKEWIAYQKTTNVFIDEFLYKAPSLNYYWHSLGPVALGISTYRSLKEEDKILFGRFLKVFELAYRRYLDIEQAGAQAREAQIEAALERVRSRSLAMHHTSEIQAVIHAVHEELLKLNISVFGGSFIVINKDIDTDLYVWGSGGTADTTTKMLVPNFGMPFCANLIKGIKQGPGFFTEEFSRRKKNDYFTELFKREPWSGLSNEEKEGILQSEGAYTRSVCVSAHTSIFIVNHYGRKFTEEENAILGRFSKVFEQSYTRFLDLQKAESQTRESQIQLALERARAQSMMMQRSTELDDTLRVFHEQVLQLNIPSAFSFLWLPDKEKDHHVFWAAWAENDSFKSKAINYPLDRTEPATAQCLVDWKSGEAVVSYRVPPDGVAAYFAAWSELIAGVEQLRPEYFNDGLYYVEAFMKYGCFGVMVKHPLHEDEKKILERFAIEFERAYTRFLDLQKAEAQSREAQVEAALERVRSRTLAMQKSDELAETSAVLFKQLIGLGISPNRLYIGIMKDEEGETEFWITDEDASKVSMAYEDNLNNNASFKKMFDGWKRQKGSLVIDMKGKVLKEYLNYLSSIHVSFKGGLAQKRRLQYIAYFSKGFIGMASPDEQPPETVQLLERFAYVFNLTFTRFNDLQLAEAHAVQAEQDLIAIKEAKQKAEETLAELQVTQKQLIQSEKMASLGELTAGIAHEIQNPLNFVNNFSEVSKELLHEMEEALEKGDADDAKTIMRDVIQNLEKISHHGKRADGIVKGMLQHSRSGGNKKEPTDINALADEYLRLAYHGLRAKEKSFNATLQTDYDESIGPVNVIPQDVGRVILNIITNAFYAVNEKNKASANDYRPTVWVSTKRENGSVIVSVTDNGNGIPKHIVDKIFQPFFTTKPTGQGTGLGLSLSYDIIKAHGGKLAVETTEGERTVFFVTLPIT